MKENTWWSSLATLHGHIWHLKRTCRWHHRWCSLKVDWIPSISSLNELLASGSWYDKWLYVGTFDVLMMWYIPCINDLKTWEQCLLHFNNPLMWHSLKGLCLTIPLDTWNNMDMCTQNKQGLDTCRWLMTVWREGISSFFKHSHNVIKLLRHSV